MIRSAFVYSLLLKYFARISACWLLLVFSGCKDLKNWETKYASTILVKFESEKDESAPKKLKNLQSTRMEERTYLKKLPSSNNGWERLNNSRTKGLSNQLIPINLKPDSDSVSFELISSQPDYYQKVTIYYDRKISLISPEAGGLQIQYTITSVQLTTHGNKKNIFNKYSIEKAVPLKKDDREVNVALYY